MLLTGTTKTHWSINDLISIKIPDLYRLMMAHLQLLVIAALGKTASKWHDVVAAWNTLHAGYHLWKVLTFYEGFCNRGKYDFPTATKMLRVALQRIKSHGARLIKDVSTAYHALSTLAPSPTLTPPPRPPTATTVRGHVREAERSPIRVGRL